MAFTEGPSSRAKRRKRVYHKGTKGTKEEKRRSENRERGREEALMPVLRSLFSSFVLSVPLW
jgi:hypothetical protein